MKNCFRRSVSQIVIRFPGANYAPSPTDLVLYQQHKKENKEVKAELATSRCQLQLASYKMAKQAGRQAGREPELRGEGKINR